MPPAKDEFERAAVGPRTSWWAEYWEFLRYHKKWWLLPILLILAALGGLVAAAGTGLLPWIYAGLF